MKTVVFRLYVLVPVVRGDNYLSPNPVHPREERVRSGLDLRDHRALRFLPPPAGGIFPAHAVNPVVRVLPVRLVDTANLQVHISRPPMDNPTNIASRDVAHLPIRRYAD